MNKKGFTLIELLAVFIVLCSIIVIALPTINDIINKGKEVTHNNQISRILSSTYDYSINSLKELPDYNETVYITLNDLKNLNYIDAVVIDPKDNSVIKDDLVISITNVGSNYKVKDQNELKKGYYLFKIEYDLTNSNLLDKKPVIVIDDLYKDSYIVNIDVGEELEKVKYNAFSYKGENLTKKVIKTIVYKETTVSKIDTNEAGIYYENYTVVDKEGNATLLTRSVIIKDNTPPYLEIPDNETISVNVKEYDLMDGVSCIDNSNKCDIKVSGKLEYGKIGKYIITYKAIDPTGNSVTEKRVITIK